MRFETFSSTSLIPVFERNQCWQTWIELYRVTLVEKKKHLRFLKII